MSSVAVTLPQVPGGRQLCKTCGPKGARRLPYRPAVSRTCNTQLRRALRVAGLRAVSDETQNNAKAITPVPFLVALSLLVDVACAGDYAHAAEPRLIDNNAQAERTLPSTSRDGTRSATDILSTAQGRGPVTANQKSDSEASSKVNSSQPKVNSSAFNAKNILQRAKDKTVVQPTKNEQETAKPPTKLPPFSRKYQSPREKDVLDIIAKGQSASDIRAARFTPGQESKTRGGLFWRNMIPAGSKSPTKTNDSKLPRSTARPTSAREVLNPLIPKKIQRTTPKNAVSAPGAKVSPASKLPAGPRTTLNVRQPAAAKPSSATKPTAPAKPAKPATPAKPTAPARSSAASRFAPSSPMGERRPSVTPKATTTNTTKTFRTGPKGKTAKGNPGGQVINVGLGVGAFLAYREYGKYSKKGKPQALGDANERAKVELLESRPDVLEKLFTVVEPHHRNAPSLAFVLTNMSDGRERVIAEARKKLSARDFEQVELVVAKLDDKSFSTNKTDSRASGSDGTMTNGTAASFSPSDAIDAGRMREVFEKLLAHSKSQRIISDLLSSAGLTYSQKALKERVAKPAWFDKTIAPMLNRMPPEKLAVLVSLQDPDRLADLIRQLDGMELEKDKMKKLTKQLSPDVKSTVERIRTA